MSTRFEITDMIDEKFFYLSLSEGKSSLFATSGTLLMLIAGDEPVYRNYHIQPNYHDMIQEKILEAFDLDISLSGAINQESNIEV